MKESLWGYLIIVLGLVIISILLLVQNLTSANEEDYYLGKEVMQSAMTEAVDYGTYQLTNGKIVMSREKFVEIFLRRFAESVTPNKTYKIEFYQIYEYPPAATVRIRTTTGTTNVKDSAINANVDTIISAILVAGIGNDIRFMEIKDEFTSDNLKKILSGDESESLDVNKDGRVDLEDKATIEYFVYGKYIRGDINKDGNLDSSDVDAMKTLIKSGNISLIDGLIADVNYDRKLDSKDPDVLKNYLDGKRNTPITTFAKGDVNKDGRVNLQDALLIWNNVDPNRTGYLTEEQKNIGDLNGNGSLDAEDYRIIENAIAAIFN